MAIQPCVHHQNNPCNTIFQFDRKSIIIPYYFNEEIRKSIIIPYYFNEEIMSLYSLNLHEILGVTNQNINDNCNKKKTKSCFIKFWYEENISHSI